MLAALLIWIMDTLKVGKIHKQMVLSHCAKVQKYEQGKIGLQFFDMWC